MYRFIAPGDRIPVGARFSALVQTGPGAHPASCTMGTGSFPGVKRPGLGAGHPHLLAPRARECILYFWFPYRCVISNSAVIHCPAQHVEC
jgi:hypothetical protein